jgi:hypothetical protein
MEAVRSGDGDRAGSFDDAVGASLHRRWNRHAERLGGLEIDDELERGWLLDREIGRTRALQDLCYVGRRTPEHVSQVGSIGHQSARVDVFPLGEDSRQPILQRQLGDTAAFAQRDGHGHDLDRGDPLAREIGKG